MPHYLLQAAYTADASAALVKNPQSRGDALRPVIQQLGGKLITSYFALGDYDVVAIMELPDNVTATAFSMAAAAGGGVKSIKTTPLISNEESVTAMKMAAGAGYKPPR